MAEEGKKPSIWDNGIGTRILATVLALTLVGVLGAGWKAVNQLGRIETKLSTVVNEMDNVRERIRYLERETLNGQQNQK